MAKLKVALLLVLIAALATVPIALAGGKTPTGGPLGSYTSARYGRPINLATAPSVPSHVVMLDGFNYCWDLDVAGSGGSFTFTGDMYGASDWSWDASGTAGRGSGITTYFAAVNPFADGCQSGLTDWFEYFGTGRRNQSGSWTSYCSGGAYGSGTWTGTFYGGSCN